MTVDARRPVLLAVLLMVLVGQLPPPVSAADANRANISVERPWARASIGTSRPAAAYLTLINNGSETARLVDIESPVARRAGVHRTVKKGEVMRMESAGKVPVPAGERVVFTPGGLHIMLMGLKQPLEKGERSPLTLHFADGSAIEVTVPVLGLGARGLGE